MSRVREEAGFTLMEVMVACVIGFVVLAGTLGLLDSTTKLNAGVMAKTDAMQRGRVAMDSLTQQLRSQVCLDWQNSAILQGATASSVTFYADFSKEGVRPVKRTITFDDAKHEIRSQRFDVPASVTAVPPLPSDYPSTPTTTNLVLQNAWHSKDDAGVDVPYLQYFAYRTVGGLLKADEPLTPPLNKAQAARVARVDINFAARPIGAKDDKKAVNVSDLVMARHADPNKSVPDPNCI